jgi:hypothetical protein
MNVKTPKCRRSRALFAGLLKKQGLSKSALICPFISEILNPPGTPLLPNPLRYKALAV